MKIFHNKQLVGELPYIKKGSPILFRWGINVDVRNEVDVIVEPVWMPLFTRQKFNEATLYTVWNKWAFFVDRQFPFIHGASQQAPILDEED